MFISGCENCLFEDSCTQFEKLLGDCDDFESIHELRDEDWAEDENEWAAILWFRYLDKDILETELETIDSW